MRRVHDEPDVSFDTAYLDIGLIGSEYGRFRVFIVVNEGFDDKGRLSWHSWQPAGGKSGCHRDRLRPQQFFGGKLEVDMHGKAQGHDVCVVLREFQGGSVLRQGSLSYAEEIHGEFPVEVMELVFILP